MKLVRRGLFQMACLLSLSSLAWSQPGGWSELWDNQLSQARAKFQEQLQARPDEPSALRGLGWVCQLEGDSAGVLQSWGRLVETHPELPQALVVWPEVKDAAERLGRTQWLREVSGVLLANARTQPALRDCAQGTLVELAGLKAPEGALREWKAIGPFENVSGSGFEKAMVLETGAGAKSTWPGKNGLQLRWRTLKAINPEGDVDLSRLSTEDDSVFYLASTLTPAQPGAAELAVDPRGAMKIWLNGKLIFLHSSYGSNAGLDLPFRVPVQLQAGANSVVVKMACRDDIAPSFLMVLRDAQGTPMSAPMTPEQADLGQAVSGQVSEAVPQGVALLQGVSDPDRGLWVARHLALDGQSQEAVAADRQVLQEHPKSALAQWELSQRLGEDGLQDESRQLRTRALQNLPSLFQASKDSADDEPDDQAKLARLQQLAGRRPDDFDTQYELYSVLNDVDKAQEAKKVLLAMAQRPASPANVRLLYTYLTLEDLHAEAQKLLTQGLVQYPNEESLRQLELRQLVKQGKVPEAIVAAGSLLQQNPEAYWTWTTLAELQRQKGDLPEALQSLQQACAQRPQDGDLLTQIGDLQQEMGRKDEAQASFREALAVDPAKVSVREKLRAAAGEKPALEWLTPPAAFDLASARSSRKDSVVYLLDEERVVVYPDSAAIFVYRAVAQVNDEAGAETLSRMRAPRNSPYDRATLEVARIRKADGHIQDVRDRGTSRGVSFPSLQAGDVVEVQWRIESVAGTLPHFWTWWNFDMSGVPVDTSHLVLAYPSQLALKEKAWGAVPPGQNAQKGDWTVREWNLQQVAPLGRYDLAAPISDRARRLEFSTVPDWKTVVDWYSDLSGPLCRADATVRAKALELTKGLTREEDKIAAIQRYVASGLRYQTTPFRNSAFVPTPGKEVLNEGFGDCKDKAALICAMLEVVGIKAHIALVSTRSNGLHYNLPSPWFNHAIVRIASSSGPLWVDGTVVQPDLRALPQEDQQVPALVIAPGTSDLTLTPLAALKSNLTERRNLGTIDGQGNLKGHFSLRGRGFTADVLRAYFKKITPEDYAEVGGVIAKELTGPNCEAGKPSLIGLQDPSQMLRIDLDYRCPGYATRVENSWLIPPPLGSTRNLATFRSAIQGSKGQPLDVMALRGLEDTRTELTLPAGYSLSKPRELHMENGAGSYRVKFFQQGNKLVADLKVEFVGTRLERKGGQELLALLTRLSAALNEPLLVKSGR